MNPFFSVCIPTTDREKTIFDTLCSVAHQSFRDFELIVVDCGSTDKTRTEIERFFSSSYYIENKFDYIYEIRDYEPKTVEDWNEPLRLASGKYIAMLEGDDQYPANHLEEAYHTLTEIPNLGLYTKGSEGQIRNVFGFVNSAQELENEIMMLWSAPPSQSIFIRMGKRGTQFFYDDVSYEYSPECDLYVKIALDGFDAYHSEKSDIVRTPSTHRKCSWHFFVDRFTLLMKYKDYISADKYNRIYRKTSYEAFSTSIGSRDPKNIIVFAYKMIKKTSLSNYLKSMKFWILNRKDTLNALNSIATK